MDTVLQLVIALAVFFGVLFVCFGSVAWLIRDAQKRGSFGCAALLFGPIVWLLIRPKPLSAQTDFANETPEDVLNRAAKLDALGEWDTARSLYQSVADRSQEHRIYAEKCIQTILDKQSRSN